MREIDALIDALAHSLALEMAICAVECASEPQREGEAEWLELDEGQMESVKGELQYLEMRGALERHPSRRNWLRITHPANLDPFAGSPEKPN